MKEKIIKNSIIIGFCAAFVLITGYLEQINIFLADNFYGFLVYATAIVTAFFAYYYSVYVTKIKPYLPKEEEKKEEAEAEEEKQEEPEQELHEKDDEESRAAIVDAMGGGQGSAKKEGD